LSLSHFHYIFPSIALFPFEDHQRIDRDRPASPDDQEIQDEDISSGLLQDQRQPWRDRLPRHTPVFLPEENREV
jgi:hypothetical protein